MTPPFPRSKHLWWPPSVVQASAITVLWVLQSPTPHPSYQHRAISFYLRRLFHSSPYLLIHPWDSAALSGSFNVNHISCAVLFSCLESLYMISFWSKTFFPSFYNTHFYLWDVDRADTLYYSKQCLYLPSNPLAAVVCHSWSLSS